MPTDTKPAERRQLRFETIDDLRAEIDRIIAAEGAGTLRTTGNWTAGQTFGHLATWIDYGWNGFPDGANPPWFIKLIIRLLLRKRILTTGMTPGMKIPRVPGGTFGIDDMPAEEGARRLRASLERLERREPAQYHSPALGKLNDDERIALHLRHAELHLGFLWPNR